MSLDVRLTLRRGDFHLDVDFSAPARGVTGLFGPSGCGKSSLLRALAGLEPGAHGRVAIQGDLWDDAHRHRPTVQRRVGYVFQEPSLFSHLSVEQNLLFGFKRLPPAERRIRRDEVIDLLGLRNLLGRPVVRLSGGEAQRVAIGRALLASPRLLLLDEPLAALDPALKADILPFLERLHETLPIPMLYVSHSMDEMVRLADHLLLMHQGRLTAQGPALTVLASDMGQHAMGRDPFSVVTGRVVTECNAHRLTEVDVGGHRMRLPKTDVRVGHSVRLRLMARDISLSLEAPRASSILNALPATVTGVGPVSDDGQRLVRLRLGDMPLLARVSALSCEILAIHPGQAVVAQIKAASVVR